MKVLAITTQDPINTHALSALQNQEEIILHICPAEEARSWLETHDADLLFLALSQPDKAMDIYIQTLQNQHPTLPILIGSEEALDPDIIGKDNIATIHLTEKMLNTLPAHFKEVITSSHRRQIQRDLYLREQLLWTVASLVPALLGEFDLDTLLQRIADEAVRLIPEAEVGSLLLCEEDTFVSRGISGYDPKLRHARFPIDLSLLPGLQEGKVIHVHQIAEQGMEALSAETRELLIQYGHAEEIEETLIAPLMRERQLIGCLTVSRLSKEKLFTPESEETLRYLATLATIGIHNTQLLTAERDARLLSETLQQVGTMLTSSLEVDRVLDGLLNALVRLIRCDAANVMLANDDEAYITRWYGYHQYSGKDWGTLHFSLTKTRNLQIAAQKRALEIIPDTQTYEGWIIIPGGEWIRSHISMPLFIGKDLIGFLNVDSAMPRAFKASDQHALVSLAPLATAALRNARLFQNERKARTFAETLQKVSTRLPQTLDETEVINAVVKEIPHLMPFHTMIIAFIQENNQVVSRYSKGLEPEVADAWHHGFPLEKLPLVQEVIRSQSGMVVPNTEKAPQWVAMQGLERVSALLVPLKSRDQVIGILILTTDQVDFFTIEHLTNLQPLADLLVVALDNAQHYTEAQRRVQDLETLRQLAIRLSALSTPHEIIRDAMQCALELTNASGCVYFQYEAENNTLTQHAVSGTEMAFPQYRIELERGASGKAWIQQQPVLVEDYTSWTHHLEFIPQEEIHALLAIPITWQEERIGVLTLFHQDSSRSFTAGDVGILQLLIQQASVNLYRANLFQAMRRDRDRLAALAEIDQKIISISNTSEETLHLILHYAIDLLGLKQGLVALEGEAPHTALTFYAKGLLHPEATRNRILENWAIEQSIHEKNGIGGYIAITDMEEKNSPEFPEGEKIRSALTIPLWIQGKVRGILVLLDSQPHVWEEQEIGLSLMLAQQASIALQKAMMAQEIRQRLEDAEVLNQILRTVNATLDTHDILQATCRALKRYFRVPRVAINLYDKGEPIIVEEETEADYPGLASEVLLAHPPLYHKVFQEQAAVSFTDLRTELPQIAHDIATGGVIILPLVLRNQCSGTLIAESAVPRSFAAREIALATSALAAITPVLENARLHQEAQEARVRAEKAYQDLQRLDGMKSQFIQNVTHELRTPLGIVKGYTELLLDESLGMKEKLDPTLEHVLSAIQQHTNKLVTLVESITALEAGETTALVCEPAPILPVLLRASQSIQQKVIRHNLELIVELPEELPLVNVDAPQLGLALQHLLDNAVKFNQPNGKIWIKAWEKEDEIFYTIQDEGIGIPQEEQERIFEQFYQVDGSARRRYEGMGMGLAIAQEIIQKHGGTIHVESFGPNQGTVFTVVLPVYISKEET